MGWRARAVPPHHRVPRTNILEEVTIVELSEAIKAGAKLHPQGFGHYRTMYRRWPWSTPEVHTCALGAATEVTGGTPLSEWPELLTTPVACPQCGMEDAVFRVIIRLNNGHRWPRERIAAWVRHLERK